MRHENETENTAIRVISTQTIAADQWLEFKQKTFADLEGSERTWSYIERTGKRGAVVVLPRFPDGSILLIKQFRIPMDAWIYEAPAGLVDDGEDLAAAALRELKEETGYTGTVRAISPAVPSSPGLATETINLVTVDLDPIPGEHERESAEAIEIFVLKKTDIGSFLERARGEKAYVDAKLYCWLLGLITS